MAAAALMAAGCSDGASSEPSVAGAGVGETIRAANCVDWNQAGPRERRKTVEQLRAFAGGPVNRGRGRTLDDDKAYRVFENRCAEFYARGFKLYKLYTRAAAFDLQRR